MCISSTTDSGESSSGYGPGCIYITILLSVFYKPMSKISNIYTVPFQSICCLVPIHSGAFGRRQINKYYVREFTRLGIRWYNHEYCIHGVDDTSIYQYYINKCNFRGRWYADIVWKSKKHETKRSERSQTWGINWLRYKSSFRWYGQMRSEPVFTWSH